MSTNKEMDKLREALQADDVFKPIEGDRRAEWEEEETRKKAELAKRKEEFRQQMIAVLARQEEERIARYDAMTPEKQAAYDAQGDRAVRRRKLTKSRIPAEERKAMTARVRELGVDYGRVYNERDRMNFYGAGKMGGDMDVVVDTLAAEFPAYDVTYNPPRDWQAPKLIIKKKPVLGEALFEPIDAEEAEERGFNLEVDKQLDFIIQVYRANIGLDNEHGDPIVQEMIKYSWYRNVPDPKFRIKTTGIHDIASGEVYFWDVEKLLLGDREEMVDHVYALAKQAKVQSDMDEGITTDGGVFKPATEDEVRQRKIDTEVAFDRDPDKYYAEWAREFQELVHDGISFNRVDELESMAWVCLEELNLEPTDDLILGFLKYYTDRYPIEPEDVDILKQKLDGEY